MSHRRRLFIQHIHRIVLAMLCCACQAIHAAPDTLDARDPYASAYSDQPPLAEKNYHELQNILPLYQEAMAHPWPTIPEGAKFKSGRSSASVPLLVERLQATHDLPADYTNEKHIYDSELESSVRNFQQRHGLTPDGVIGKNTRAELNVPPDVRLRQIVLNIQRWASLAPKLKNRFILVNIPDFELYVYDDNQKVLSMKAIVGRPTRQTPELISKVTRIVFNPYWNVPEMIANKDIVPKAMENPNYLSEENIRIFTNQEDNAREINPDAINWRSAKINGFPYFFRQDPGTTNALGLVKFEFFNSNNVYLHDTPAKDLFDQEQRIFSSGCVRLEQPFELVSYLMHDDPNWGEDRMQNLLDMGKTAYVKAFQPTPIVITYITAWVDDDGLVNFRQDIYGKDQPENANPPQSPETDQD